jgi:uncharacterized membrane protein HdeD (DUF308 family)
MLDWKNLTTQQRLTCILFAAFICAAAIIAMLGVDSQSDFFSKDVFALLGVLSLMLGVLINPDAVRGNAAALSLTKIPRASKILYLVGFFGIALHSLISLMAWLSRTFGAA